MRGGFPLAWLMPDDAASLLVSLKRVVHGHDHLARNELDLAQSTAADAARKLDTQSELVG